jgi:antirepressor regulating drug resistance, predicted signal transduction N-terminal membrane component
MSVIFLKLLNLSISASWLVLVVLVLRLVLKRAPKWVDVLLWGMVALRLMLPFSIESALSLIPSAETLSPEVVQFDPAPTITSGVELIDNAVNPSLSESFAAAPLASVNLLYVWTYLAGWVWLIGLAAMLLYALVSYLRLRRRVSASIPLRENIYVCDEVASPFILGILRPRIYLPSALDEAQRGSVLSHERAHLARRDHWWKPLGFALLAVYWFNPLLWLAYTLLCRDIELACDERVLCGMDAGQVKDYSSALLACSVPRRMLAACPLAFGEVGVGARVKNALRYKKPAFWVVAASVAVCVVVAVCFLTNPRTDTDAAGLVGFHREQVTYADVTDESGAQPSSVQLTAEETDAVYALLDTLQYKRLGAASAMQDCYARLYFISAAGERCEIMLSEREMLVNPITDGKTARLYELRSGSTELRDYLFGCIGASEPAEEEMKTMTEPTLSLTLTVPAAWEDIAELSAYDKGTAYLGYGIMLFHLSEKNALAAYPDGGMGSVWWLVAMSWDNFKEWRGYDALPVPEILGIAEYVLGADDEYVYLLVLPSDVQFLENDPVSQRQYEALQSDSQGVLTRFLKDNGIHINDMCPASSVFSPPARGDAFTPPDAVRSGTVSDTSYDKILTGAGEGEEQRTSENDAEHTAYSVKTHAMTAEERSALDAQTEPAPAAGTAFLPRSSRDGASGNVCAPFTAKAADVAFVLYSAPGATDYNVRLCAGEPGAGKWASNAVTVKVNDGVRFSGLTVGQAYYMEVSSDTLSTAGCTALYKCATTPPPARSGTVSFTGYAAYDALLAEIADLRRSGASDVQTDFSHDLLSVNDYYQTPGWLLRDLDGDGTSELLLGADWGDGYGVIFNIYRLDGAKAVRVVDGWSRSRYFLCSDGTLAHEWSGGADHWGRTYLRYGETLLPIESVFDRGGVWYHAKGLDALSLEDTQLEGRCKVIPSAEAEQLMERYTKQYEALPFTPFEA